MNKAEIIDYVKTMAQACGVDPTIAYYQLKRESIDFRSDVVFGPTTGGSGERGVAQFMKGTWPRFGQGSFDNAFKLEYAMPAYCGYMGYLLGLFNGDYSKALTGYNGGEGHLTDPKKHGPPSAAALRYAAEILAQAGASGGATPGGGSGAGAGAGLGLSATSTTLILVAALGLGALFFLDDGP